MKNVFTDELGETFVTPIVGVGRLAFFYSIQKKPLGRVKLAVSTTTETMKVVTDNKMINPP
jgi:hypothetical protein